MTHKTAGEEMYRWAADLFPVNRSLTGPGVRETLAYIKNILPDLRLHEIASGTPVFDWEVPKEWSVEEAWIEDETGRRIVDFADNNLHLMGYSVPVDTWLERDELAPHIHTLPEQPDLIPYRTSYYEEQWGFCMAHRDKVAMPEGRYRVVIRSELKEGVLDYADLVLPGRNKEEILFSTYICHPSMANNELSGIVMAVSLASWLSGLPERKYTYRFVFAPETIGAIVYIHEHLHHLQSWVKAGYVLTCVGDERAWSFMPSRRGDTLADRLARFVLKESGVGYTEYSFLERGSDERQYCSPGVDLPVASVMRSRYVTYPEYHTSGDDLTFISPGGLQDSFDLYRRCIELAEANFMPKVTVRCEPQLGKRGLYPKVAGEGLRQNARDMRNILAYSDGTLDLIGLFEKTGVGLEEGIAIVRELTGHGLLAPAAPEGRVTEGSGHGSG